MFLGLRSSAAPADTGTREKVLPLLARPMTADETAIVALLLNPDLQAMYADLGMSQADLVQAGLFKNPIFEGYVRFPSAGGNRPLDTNTSFSVAWDVLDVVLRSARKKLAAVELAQVEQRLGDAVARQTFEAKAACYTLQGHMQMLAMLKDIAEAAETTADLARRQGKAGNLSELDVVRQEAMAAQSHVDVVRAEAQVQVDRQALARQMGLLSDGPLVSFGDNWSVVGSLPQPAALEPSLVALEDAALRQRQDVMAARLEIDAVDRRISLARRSSLGFVNLGVSTERDADRFRVTGPTLAFGIPLFDRNQAQVSRLEAALRSSRSRLSALTQEVRATVRSEYARMMAARGLVAYYGDEILPKRRRVLALSLQQYNAMLLGVYALLQARQDEISAHRDFLDTLRDYWISRAALERAVGGRLPPPSN